MLPVSSVSIPYVNDRGMKLIDLAPRYLIYEADDACIVDESMYKHISEGYVDLIFKPIHIFSYVTQYNGTRFIIFDDKTREILHDYTVGGELCPTPDLMKERKKTLLWHSAPSPLPLKLVRADDICIVNGIAYKYHESNIDSSVMSIGTIYSFDYVTKHKGTRTIKIDLFNAKIVSDTYTHKEPCPTS